jgi:hypothetical protein
MSHRIELLVIPGCPHVSAALAAITTAIHQSGSEAEVAEIVVRSESEALALGFLGSPTVRVDGLDVEDGAAERVEPALSCRVYAVDGRFVGAPPAEWIVAALRGARVRGSSDVGGSSGCCGCEN